MERLTERFMYYAGILAAAGANVDDLKYISDLLDAEEQGRLLKLPAKIGSTIYWLRIYGDDSKRIFPVEVVRYATKEDKSGKRYAEEIKTRLNGFSKRFSVTEFGRTLFLTQEEAEKALEEMEGI